MNVCPTSFSLSQIAENIFQQIEHNLNKSESQKISDKDLLSLYSIYGPVFLRGLEILEKQVLTFYHTANDCRALIEIKGENNRCYRLFPRINFCECLAFKHQVIERRSQLTCKHVIAARIALLTNKFNRNEITNKQYLILLKMIYVFDGEK